MEKEPKAQPVPAISPHATMLQNGPFVNTEHLHWNIQIKINENSRLEYWSLEYPKFDPAAKTWHFIKEDACMPVSICAPHITITAYKRQV